MTVKVFPTVNAVGGLGSGKTITEANLIAWLKQLIAQNFVVSGFTVPASSANLILSVALGQACIDGRRVDIDTATNVTCTASATNHIYLKLTKDASQNVTGAAFEVNTTGVAPADSVKIATAVAGATAVTSTTDARVLYPFAYSQMPYTAVNKAGDIMTGPLSFTDANAQIKRSGNWLTLTSSLDRAVIEGKLANTFAQNAYNDGANWQRFDTAQPAVLLDLNGGTVYVYTAPAGANPIAWNGGYTVYHTGNDGPGSTLDADTVDGIHGNAIALFFGDGSDGDVTISTNTTLTRDMYYNNLTINSGVTLTTAGFRVFVKGTLTNNGTIDCSGARGGDATTTAVGTYGLGGGSDSTGIASGILGWGTNSTQGSSSGTAGATSQASNSYGGQGGADGGNSGTVSAPPVTDFAMKTYPSCILLRVTSGKAGISANGPGGASGRIMGGTGGTGGGSAGASAFGGGGGGGGGVICISAFTLTNNGTISAKGGDGGNANGTSSAARGGSGGGGGCIVIIYHTKPAAGTLSVSGGTGGTGYGGYAAGLSGNAGTIFEITA